ncbi:sulfotransferase [Rhodohalobacter sp. 614A]|uniref:sulfotransferase n=1 Tax=Rhodohalobacter sp. 614A TaxID=2908649 RepID=UPI001F42699A|nr:sulfotransferase [Rhodohalobacter sp. 614A]
MAFRYGFLTYLSRSGSTFLSNLLNNYADICVTLEGDFPPELLGVKNRSVLHINAYEEIDYYFDYIVNNSRVSSWDLDLRSFKDDLYEASLPISGADIFKKLLEAYRNKHKPNATVVLYKGVPFLPWMLDEVVQNFPESQVIHLFRDPRAVYNSQKGLPLPYEERDFVFNPFQTVDEWKRSVQKCNHPVRQNVLPVRYEDLILNTEAIRKQLISFLKTSDNLATENTFSQRIPDQEQVIHQDVAKSPKKEKIHRWKENLEPREIEILEIGLGELLKEHAYDLSGSHNTIPSQISYYKSYLSYTFYTVFHRIKRIINGVRTDPSKYYIKLKSRF